MIGRARYSPIGFDAGSRTIKAVQLVHTRAGPRVHAAASFPRIAGGEELNAAEIIRAAGILARQGFVGDRVVPCISPSKTLSAMLELPARTSGAPIDSIARQELARSARKEPGVIELAWWELPSPTTGARAPGTQALAVGCAHADAETLMSCFEPAGFDVLAIDTRPTALARACAPLLSPPPHLSAVLEMGYSAAHILILVGRTLVYERSLPEASLRLLTSGVANQLSTDDAFADQVLRTVGCRELSEAEADMSAIDQIEDARALICAHTDALTGELRTSMSYATRRFDGSLMRILLSGAGADIPGVAERIGQRTGVETLVARVDALATPPEATTSNVLGPAAAVALGLALHDDGTARSRGGAA